MAIEGRPLTQLAHCPGPQKEAASALPLALDATVFGSETAARVISDLMRLIGIDSCARTLPLGRHTRRRARITGVRWRNMGVRRRQMHEPMPMPDYDRSQRPATEVIRIDLLRRWNYYH